MSEVNRVHFTVTVLDKLEVPNNGIAVYKDIKAPSLRLYVTCNGIKTFFVRKRIKGRDKRVIIGQYPTYSIEQARKKANVLLGIIADRKDPLEEGQKEKQDNLTFGEHFKAYMERYSKLHKKSWEYDEREINRFVSDWFPRRLSDITKLDIELRHAKIGRESGKTQANTIVRRLSSIFNKAIYWGWSGTNPTKGIKKFKEKTRDRFILPNEMPYFIRALNEEENEDFKDYFTVLLLTGVRKTNTRKMNWDQLNFHLGEWKIPDTKNDEPLVIPLVSGALEVLKRRKTYVRSVWVFPQKENPKKPIADPKRPWKRILARATLHVWNNDELTVDFMQSQIKKFKSYYAEYTVVEKLKALAAKEGFNLPPSLTDLRIHDIRRTFGSYQVLTGTNLPVIGRSLGHKSLRSTEIYARLNLDPVRASVERATGMMLNIAEPPPG